MIVPSMMQAVVYRGIKQLCLETIPVPEIGPDELLVKVAVCGVCPTDIKKIHYGSVAAPRIFGHETAGTIARVGAQVQGFAVGERVALHHHVPCLECHACRHKAFAQCAGYKRTGITAGFEPAGGGYAEYVRVMSFCLPGVVKIPDGNSFREGAMLEPVNTVLKAIHRLNLLPGDHALVVGQGPIGLMFTRLLSLRGLRVLAIDLWPSRLELARQFGAHWVKLANEADVGTALAQVTGPQGLDAAILAVPSDAAFTQAFSWIRGAGQILLFAHTRRGNTAAIDLAEVCVEEKDLLGSYSSDITLQEKAAELVFSRKLDVNQLITHAFSLEETARAIDLAAAPTEKSLKILVEIKGK